MAAEAVNTISVVHQLAPVLADAGYSSEEEMAKLATSKLEIELVIALGR